MTSLRPGRAALTGAALLTLCGPAALAQAPAPPGPTAAPVGSQR